MLFCSLLLVKSKGGIFLRYPFWTSVWITEPDDWFEILIFVLHWNSWLSTHVFLRLVVKTMLENPDQSDPEIAPLTLKDSWHLLHSDQFQTTRQSFMALGNSFPVRHITKNLGSACCLVWGTCIGSISCISALCCSA